MLNANQLADRIDKYQRGSLSLLAFEDWFSDQSWNIHQTNNQIDIDAVFAIDAVLARRHSDQLGEEALKRELEIAIRPFVPQNYILVLPGEHPEVRATSNNVIRKPQKSESQPLMDYWASLADSRGVPA
jgi:hypothetical protein